MMTGRTGRQDLEPWLAAIEADDGQPDLRSLATGIRHDQQAVTNGLTLPWSSGKVEGTVNIKMIKRQMYGRAGFGLLRKRVILHPALPGSQDSRKSQVSCPRGLGPVPGWYITETVIYHLSKVARRGSSAGIPRFAGSRSLRRPGQPGGGARDRRA
jgi:hypothetical protein